MLYVHAALFIVNISVIAVSVYNKVIIILLLNRVKSREDNSYSDNMNVLEPLSHVEFKRVVGTRQLSQLSCWRIGGVTRRFYEVTNLKELTRLLRFHPGRIYPIGGLSNILIADELAPTETVLDLLLIHFGTAFSRLSCLESCTDLVRYLVSTAIQTRHTHHNYNDSRFILAQAGVRLGQLVHYALSQGLVDAIFLAGIPGTIGGAVRMNAGAYGDELWRHLVAVKLLHRNGDYAWYPAAAFAPGYRQVEGLGEEDCVLAVVLQFTSGDVGAARAKMRVQLQRRRASQPLELANCGSVFRNPPGDYAARLIESCQLKGQRCGGAEISTKHANFIVNREGRASCQDILQLITLARQEVQARYGIELQLEIKRLGC